MFKVNLKLLKNKFYNKDKVTKLKTSNLIFD